MSDETATEMLVVLKLLLRNVNNIEVLGEWHGADVNYSLRKREGARLEKIYAECRAVIIKAEKEILTEKEQ